MDGLIESRKKHILDLVNTTRINGGFDVVKMNSVFPLFTNDHITYFEFYDPNIQEAKRRIGNDWVARETIARVFTPHVEEILSLTHMKYKLMNYKGPSIDTVDQLSYIIKQMDHYEDYGVLHVNDLTFDRRSRNLEGDIYIGMANPEDNINVKVA